MRSFVHSKVFILGIFVLLFFPFYKIHAADLIVSPSSGTYSIGKTFPVNVYVSSGQSINAVSGTLTFPADELQVISVSKYSSILTLWVSDPTFSNSAGTIDFEGVVPNPGYTGSAGNIITINFKVIGSGNAIIRWNTGSILANDGTGTNILKNLNTANFVLGGSAPIVSTPVTTPTVTKGGIKITSSTYPDSTKWYTATDGNFTWNVPDSVTAVRLLVGKLANATPSVVYEPPIDNKQITGTTDGVWYFSLQGKTSDGWGPITHYKFRVDSTPPESFVVKSIPSDDSTNPTPSFSFSATDSISGIDHYTIETDGGSPIVWNDNASGIYTTEALGPGKHTILAKAYDEAGNSTPASIDFTIAGIQTPVISSFTDNVSTNNPLIIKGTAIPNVTIKISLAKSAGIGGMFSTASADVSPYTQTTQSDSGGSWSIAVDTSSFASGAYDLIATAVDTRGAQSYPTASKTVLVNSSWWQSVGSSIIKILAITIPVLALLFTLIIIFLRGFYGVRKTNNKYLKEVHNIERLVDKAFALLKEDVEDSIKLLERTKSRRKLTEEEDAIIKRLRRNLDDAEEIIHKQVQKVENEIQD